MMPFSLLNLTDFLPKGVGEVDKLVCVIHDICKKLKLELNIPNSKEAFV